MFLEAFILLFIHRSLSVLLTIFDGTFDFVPRRHSKAYEKLTFLSLRFAWHTNDECLCERPHWKVKTEYDDVESQQFCVLLKTRNRRISFRHKLLHFLALRHLLLLFLCMFSLILFTSTAKEPMKNNLIFAFHFLFLLFHCSCTHGMCLLQIYLCIGRPEKRRKTRSDERKSLHRKWKKRKRQTQIWWVIFSLAHSGRASFPSRNN